MDEIQSQLNALNVQIQTLMDRLDLVGKEEEAESLEQRAAAPEFWNDADGARRAMRRLRELQDDLSMWRDLSERSAMLMDLAAEVTGGQNDPLRLELAAEAAALAADLGVAEAALLMSGEYDGFDAILAIHAGAGGTESQDWALMLERLYLRWADKHHLKVAVVDRMPGEEAGIKSVTFTLSGRNAYGLLKSERGVHRLVRISPFDASARRHTSFALVELSPAIEDDVTIEIKDDDLRVDVFRASGAGGQHVNKTSSAVRMTHLPTGVVVSCQNERSQAQNRDTAMKLLRARLLELRLEEREVEQARLKGQHVEAGWGNQIRSYVLQPYQMVKDHRTSFEVGNAQGVLDGDIDGFIDAYLRQQIGETAGG
ncbi:MAG TPA: peptide chain release factor 2 [Anaerolineae bacterium]|nr:peptide chain release factor 2 [Ardenticatenia bacterium]MBK8541289.1 peptide chain release factor 2 [Ardenticatenia bacterium]HQZ70499.1 peptide chain release factor 2 [Anaerolineae bacterium]HRA19361.1 peptide chain release factor 2 [Anaerolineae bacterium]